MNFLYTDTEYSSFFSPVKSKTGELLQVAMIPVIDGIQREPFNQYCKPLTRKWNSHAEKVHKITRTQAEMQQHPEELAIKMVEYIKGFDCVFQMVGHNTAGDKSYLDRLVSDYKLILPYHRAIKKEWGCTKKKADARANQIGTKSRKLEDLCNYFDIKIHAHDALSDAIATMHLDNKLSNIQTINKSIQVGPAMSKLQIREKYLDRKYLMINGEGSVYIQEEATANPEAMKVIIEELWNLYVEKTA